MIRRNDGQLVPTYVQPLIVMNNFCFLRKSDSNIKDVTADLTVVVGIGRSGRLKGINAALVACHNSGVMTSYDQTTLKQITTIKFTSIEV